MQSSYARIRVALAGILSVMVLATAARAADRSWNKFDSGNPVSGDFGDAANWDPSDAFPGTDDWALFDNDATDAYTVTLEGLFTDRTIQGLQVLTDKVILDTFFNELNLTAAAPNLLVGIGSADPAASHTGVLTIQGAGTVKSVGANFGVLAGSSGHVTVRGAGTQLLVAGTGPGTTTNPVDPMRIGQAGSGTLIVGGPNVADHGAYVSAGYATLGSATTSKGYVLVQGKESHFAVTQTGAAITLLSNYGALHVLDGGKITVTAATRLGSSNSDHSISLLVSGTDADGNPSTFKGGTLEIGNSEGTPVEISNGGLLDAGTVTIGRRGNNMVRVDAGTVISGTVNLGRWPTDHTIEVVNGGTWTGTALQANFLIFRNRAPRSHVIVDGGKVVDDEFVSSQMLITGNARLGTPFNETINGGLASVYGSDATTASGALIYADFEATLTVRNGGRFQTNAMIEFSPSATLTVEEGVVQSRTFVVLAGGVQNDVASNSEYVLTLGDYSSATAPVRVVKVNDAGGDVTLMNGELYLTLAFALDEMENLFAPELNQTFGVLSYEGALTGYFKGYAPTLGTTRQIEQGGYEFLLDYGSGTNDVITLTVIPEPHTIGLLLAAGGLLALRRRRPRA